MYDKLLYRKEHQYYTADVYESETGRMKKITVSNLKETPGLEWPAVRSANELENIRKVLTHTDKKYLSKPIKAIHVFWTPKEKFMVFPIYSEVAFVSYDPSEVVEAVNRTVVCEEYSVKIGENWSPLKLQDLTRKARERADNIDNPSDELNSFLKERAESKRDIAV